MSRTLLIVACLGALALPAAVEGQVGFGVAGGVAQPVRDFGNYAVAGPTVSGLVNVGIPLAPAGIRFEGTYGKYDYKPFLTSDGGHVRMISGTANAMLSMPGPIGPYAIGGIGYYRSTAKGNGGSGETSKVGYNGGLGFRVGLFGVAAFAEARWHYIPGANTATIRNVTTGTDLIPLTVGLTF